MPPRRFHLLRYFFTVAVLLPAFFSTARAWVPNAQELEIAQRMKSASGQHRAFLAVDPILSQVARERAADMARRHYFDHIDPDGHGANYLVRTAGYVLPAGYPGDGNNLESIAAGGSTASTTWSDWMGSPDHKRHLLGEIDFFAEQTSYGVGYYEDAGAPYRFYWVVITAPAMPRSTTIAIASPAEGAAIPEGLVSAAGTTDGNQAAATVQVSMENSAGTSAWTSVNGTTNWSATLSNVVPGANTLHVRSLDSGGAVLAQAARGFQYVVVRPLTIRVVGQGAVEQFAGTTSRRVGVTYSMTATPAAGWLFAGWSGSWGGAQPTVNVLMREGLSATATFVPNPFVAKRGMYGALIGESSASHHSRGQIRLQLTAFGKVTGQLFWAGESYALMGQFRLDGRATVRIPRDGAPPLVLVLDLNGSAGPLTGTLLQSGGAITFLIDPAREGGASLAAFAGRYTVAFPASRNNAAEVPGGDGYGVLTVSADGAATLSAALADGTAFSRGGWIAADGGFAFYTPLYAGGGELSGLLAFGNQPDSDLAGSLTWIKPRTTGAARFRAAFTTTIATVGARYAPPAAGQPALAVSAGNANARLTFGAGNFAADIIQPAHLATNNVLTIASPSLAALTATIDPASGMFLGAFRHPVTGIATRFRGVILQKRKAGAGFFLGQSQSGFATLAPAP